VTLTFLLSPSTSSTTGPLPFRLARRSSIALRVARVASPEPSKGRRVVLLGQATAVLLGRQHAVDLHHVPAGLCRGVERVDGQLVAAPLEGRQLDGLGAFRAVRAVEGANPRAVGRVHVDDQVDAVLVGLRDDRRALLQGDRIAVGVARSERALLLHPGGQTLGLLRASRRRRQDSGHDRQERHGKREWLHELLHAVAPDPCAGP
jgi:hypothetical protein